MDKIKYESFKNICRMCMLNCDVNFNRNSVMLDIFYKVTDIHFETNDGLPQQICLKCFNFINEIYAFSITCKDTHAALVECLNGYKNKRIKEEQEITEETNDQIEIGDEITIEEHKIEFVAVELDNDIESNDLFNKDVIELPVDLLPPVPTYIQTETENDSLNIINSNDLNKGSYLSDSDSDIKTTKDKQNKFKIPIGKEHKRKHIIEHPPVSEINNKVQRRRYKCDQCEKTFINSQDLDAHKRVHYQCDQCEKSFTGLWKLNVHKRMHTGERPYKCGQCEKSFNTSSYMKIHKRVHSGERLYKCDQCEKSCLTSGDLKTHKRVHTGERPYKCDLCKKTFTRSHNLKKHKRVLCTLKI